MRHYPYIYIYIYNNVSAATNEQERTTLITNRPYIYIYIFHQTKKDDDWKETSNMFCSPELTPPHQTYRPWTNLFSCLVAKKLSFLFKGKENKSGHAERCVVHECGVKTDSGQLGMRGRNIEYVHELNCSCWLWLVNIYRQYMACWSRFMENFRK
jgi:hypothetical protein